MLKDISFDPDILTVTWADGRRERFHAIWLRDNARGPNHRHPENDQRLFDIAGLPEKVSISDAAPSAAGVTVHFEPESISVDYPADFLAAYGYDRPPAPSETETWGAAHRGVLVRHDFAAITADPAAKKVWLDDIVRHGIALLTGVPCREGAVCEVAELFGYVRDTNYGRLFEVRSEAKPINLAYTPVGLNVHTDNPYRDPVPGLQLLHCLVNAAEGGESVFVDGFRVAELMRLEAPEQFARLTKAWAPFRFRDAGADLSARGPYIRLDDRGRVTAIRYNNRSAAPLDLPFSQMANFYEALRTFAAMLHREDGEMRLKLAPGDLVCFDNERVLHGRTGFSGGARHLQGCYADKDALRSLAAVLDRPKREAAE